MRCFSSSGFIFVVWIEAPLSAGLHGDPSYGHAQLDFTFIDQIHKTSVRDWEYCWTQQDLWGEGWGGDIGLVVFISQGWGDGEVKGGDVTLPGGSVISHHKPFKNLPFPVY